MQQNQEKTPTQDNNKSSAQTGAGTGGGPATPSKLVNPESTVGGQDLKQNEQALRPQAQMSQVSGERSEKQRIAQQKQNIEKLMQDIRSEKSKLQKQQDSGVSQNPPSSTPGLPDQVSTPKKEKAEDLDLKLGELSGANSTVERNDKTTNKREKKQKRKQNSSLNKAQPQSSQNVESGANEGQSRSSIMSDNSQREQEGNKPNDTVPYSLQNLQENSGTPPANAFAASSSNNQQQQSSSQIKVQFNEDISMIDSTKKQLFSDSQPATTQPAQPVNFLDKLKPAIKEKFEEIDGACEYFYVLEKQNEQIQEDKVNQQIKDDKSSPTAQLDQQPKLVLNVMPKGYPQKHMYKHPRLCAETCQIEIDHNEYKGSKEQYYKVKEEEHLMVYQNQQHDVPAKRRRMRTKRSNSVQLETLKFHDPYCQSRSSDNGSVEGRSKKRPKVYTNMNDSMIKRKIQRRDEIKAPQALNQEPKVSFISQEEGKYDIKQLDEYLDFCHFVMRESPIQGNYCGIWLRGGPMYKEKALQLLNLYRYNFDLAKFHILYPQVMMDPEKKSQLLQLAETHPQDLAKEVANAIIDLQGCKKDEADQILNKFREDLANRINEEQLKYHLTILHKIKIPTPADIEEKIRKSIEFSKDIKRKCNIQATGSKSIQNIPQDKKLKMTELIDLYEQQKTYSYITSEMIILQQQLEKARQWQERVEKLRDKEIHFKQIDQIYSDGKNIPVNFQDLMKEIKNRKQQAETLNSRIQDAMVVRKTRQRISDNKRSRRGAVAEDSNQKQLDAEALNNNIDKEQQFRDLLEEAKEMKIQSDQIFKLHNKVQEIDKWKIEVETLFFNSNEEKTNYKRYKDHYKTLLARSTPFQIELTLMRDLQKKCSFIDWRSRIEDIIDRLENDEKMTLEQIQMILDEGECKGFITKNPSGFFIRFQNDEINQENELSIKVLEALFCNFEKLDRLIQIYQETKQFDRDISKILEKINMKQEESQEDDSSSNQQMSNESKAQKQINIEEIKLLEKRGTEIKVEVEKLKEFKIQIALIRQYELDCQKLLEENQSESHQQLVIGSQAILNEFLESRKKFLNLNIISEQFENFHIEILPYIHWINKSSKLVKQYSRAALGLKQSQLALFEPIEESENREDARQNPFNMQTDYQSLKALSDAMKGPNDSKFSLFKDTEIGQYIDKILQKTKSLNDEFENLRQQKRSDNFDLNKYFKLLEHIQNSGLPEETSIIEEAKVELKRERWIKKYNDLQQITAQQLQNQPQTQQNNDDQSQSQVSQTNKSSPQQLGHHGFGGGPNQRGHVRIKTLDVLIKEYQGNPELNLDPTCQQLAQKLINQQMKCLNWLNKFNEIFNSQDQFEPKGGLRQIESLIQEGAELDIQLKEYIDLQTHQKEMVEWNQTNVQIFNNSKSVTLDQLKKHIKDSYEITEGGNPKLIELLDSLKEITTIWKIFARTILKIRPIENFNGIVQQNNQQNGHCDQQQLNDRDLFCICRQPENPDTGSLMLCCDFCDMWYHTTCVGLPPDLKLEKVKYKCIGCAIREGKMIYYDLQNLKHNLGNRVGSSLDNLHMLEQLNDQTTQQEQGPGTTGSQSNHRDMQQQEIENLLLEYFHQKSRISMAQFKHVFNEGKANIPLKLEEMNDLQFIYDQITQWQQKAQIEISKSRRDSTYQIYQNFKIINNLDEYSNSQVQEDMIIQLQYSERDRDENLIRLIIQSQSFPVFMQETLDLIQILRYRDWLRESLKMFYAFNQRNIKGKETINASKINKQNKQNKIQFRKDVKRQIYKGEILKDLSISPPSESNQLPENLQTIIDILSQLIIKPGNLTSEAGEGGPTGTGSRSNTSQHINTQTDIFGQIHFNKQSDFNSKKARNTHIEKAKSEMPQAKDGDNELMEINYDEQFEQMNEEDYHNIQNAKKQQQELQSYDIFALNHQGTLKDKEQQYEMQLKNYKADLQLMQGQPIDIDIDIQPNDQRHAMIGDGNHMQNMLNAQVICQQDFQAFDQIMPSSVSGLELRDQNDDIHTHQIQELQQQIIAEGANSNDEHMLQEHDLGGGIGPDNHQVYVATSTDLEAQGNLQYNGHFHELEDIYGNQQAAQNQLVIQTSLQPRLQLSSDLHIQQPLLDDQDHYNQQPPALEEQLQIDLGPQTPEDLIANNYNFQRLKVISEELQQIIERDELQNPEAEGNDQGLKTELNKWLFNTAQYTNEILTSGQDKEETTQEFIDAGQQLLLKFHSNNQPIGGEQQDTAGAFGGSTQN